ncbi:hypothetical protein [Bradyrhizobium centrosematis]|nr:hypothetical protein [Bradyrhizobium centrosematis]MCS3762243.1 hypothetical protein [Bradyrhizobium centrosematis]MCS3774912.1 hypothetical protein [Bradyrhizobium centrosematis]
MHLDISNASLLVTAIVLPAVAQIAAVAALKLCGWAVAKLRRLRS